MSAAFPNSSVLPRSWIGTSERSTPVSRSNDSKFQECWRMESGPKRAPGRNEVVRSNGTPTTTNSDSSKEALASAKVVGRCTSERRRRAIRECSRRGSPVGGDRRIRRAGRWRGRAREFLFDGHNVSIERAVAVPPQGEAGDPDQQFPYEVLSFEFEVGDHAASGRRRLDRVGGAEGRDDHPVRKDPTDHDPTLRTGSRDGSVGRSNPAREPGVGREPNGAIVHAVYPSVDHAGS